jgi:hypothetical protein
MEDWRYEALITPGGDYKCYCLLWSGRWPLSLIDQSAHCHISANSDFQNLKHRKNLKYLIFVWPCIIETNNTDNQLDAMIMIY